MIWMFFIVSQKFYLRIFGRVNAVSFDSLNNLWKDPADPDWEGTTEYYVADKKKQSFGNNN